jgi:hypothetical protein
VWAPRKHETQSLQYPGEGFGPAGGGRYVVDDEVTPEQMEVPSSRFGFMADAVKELA